MSEVLRCPIDAQHEPRCFMMFYNVRYPRNLQPTIEFKRRNTDTGHTHVQMVDTILFYVESLETLHKA